MNYELAKQLRDEGFPRKTRKDFAEQGFIDFPTLEELIEACPNLFKLIRRKDWWTAEPVPRTNLPIPMSLRGVRLKGSTPSEALANLWLALNKK